MTPYELSVARRRAYHLFGRLFFEGITADLLPQLEVIPELAEAARPFDADEAAADHYKLTSVDVFPYESIFLDPSGLLGGRLSDDTAEFYANSGYEVLSDYDHLGYELGFLAHLCGLEAAALVEGNKPTAFWVEQQQVFLAGHLLRWLPPLTIAIERSGSSFYGRLANLTLELCVDHLQGHQPADHSGPIYISSLPRPPQMDAQDSSLKDIAGILTTPPYSGFFLSRDAVSALARRHKIPRGFGDRAQMLTNLLRTAGQYDAAGAVFSDLASICQEWAGCYQEQYERLPKLRPWLRPWLERVNETAESLNKLTAVIEDAP